MTPSAEADAPAHLRRFTSKRLPEKYADARTHAVTQRADVIFIPSSDALRAYRRDGWRMAVGPSIFSLLMFGRAIGEREWYLLMVAVPCLALAVAFVVKAIRIRRLAPSQLPPMGLSLWDDALVAYVTSGVTVVPRSAIRACNTGPGDHGSGLSLTALDRRGDTPPRTIGWFDMDPGELRMTVDAWLSRPPQA